MRQKTRACPWRWTGWCPRHDRRELDLPRRQPRRGDHRLRLPRRPVLHPHRRRRRDAAHRGDGVRRSAAVLARRVAHRRHVRRRRRAERLVMDSDGSDPVQISKGASNRAESPEWMPDGDYVVAAMGAFRLSGLPKLKLFHVDGGSGVQLIAEPDNLKTLGPAVSPSVLANSIAMLPCMDNLKTLGPAVSPDGRYIWYSRRTGDWQYNAQLHFSISSRPTTWRPASATGRPCGPRCRRTGGGWSSARATTSTRGWCCATWRRGKERWLACPVQNDDQESRATLECCRACRSRPTRATSWPRGAAGCGRCRWRAGRPSRSRSGCAST